MFLCIYPYRSLYLWIFRIINWILSFNMHIYIHMLLITHMQAKNYTKTAYNSYQQIICSSVFPRSNQLSFWIGLLKQIGKTELHISPRKIHFIALLNCLHFFRIVWNHFYSNVEMFLQEKNDIIQWIRVHLFKYKYFGWMGKDPHRLIPFFLAQNTISWWCSLTP